MLGYFLSIYTCDSLVALLIFSDFDTLKAAPHRVEL